MKWESEGNKQKLKLRICEQLMIERSCQAGSSQGPHKTNVAVGLFWGPHKCRRYAVGLRNTSRLNEVYEFASKRLKYADVLRVPSITPRKHIFVQNYKYFVQ